MSGLEIARKIFEAVGIARSILIFFSIGIAHNIAFLSLLPRNFITLLDATFLANISIQYIVFLSTALVLAIIFSHAAAFLYGTTLGHYVDRLYQRKKSQLKDLKKRKRYVDLVRRRSDKWLRSILFCARWLLPSSIVGYFYAGLVALVSLPILIILFFFSLPILYPRIKFDIFIKNEAKIENADADFWVSAFSDVSRIKQMAMFAASALILLSASLGVGRHNHLMGTAEFVLKQKQQEAQLSIIGMTSQGVVAFNTAESNYQLVLFKSFDRIMPVAR